MREGETRADRKARQDEDDSNEMNYVKSHGEVMMN
jgi:hypothetical protein